MEGEEGFQEQGIVKIIFRDDHDEILNENYEKNRSKIKKMLRDPAKKLYQCKSCQKVFKHHPSLARHVKIHHSKIKAKKVLRSCDKCGKAFSAARELKKHIDIHHLGLAEKYKQKCHICLKNVQQLKTHIRFMHKGQQHLSEFNGSCPQCFKIFSNDYGVKRHIKAVHLKVKPWECGECGKRFNDKKDLVRHHRGVHLGEKVNTWHKQDGGQTKTSRTGQSLHKKKNLVQDTLTKSDGFATSEMGTEVQELPRDVLAQDMFVADQNMILDNDIANDIAEVHNEDVLPENPNLKEQSSDASIDVIYDRELVGNDKFCEQSRSDSVIDDSKHVLIQKSKKSKILQVEQNRFELIEERVYDNGDVVLEIQEIEQENDSNKGIKIIEGCTKTFEKNSESEESRDKNYVTLRWASNSKENQKNVKSKFKKIYPDGLTRSKKDSKAQHVALNQSPEIDSKERQIKSLDINLKIADIIKDPDSDLEEELTEEDFSAVGSTLHEGSEIDILPMLSKGSAETAFKHRVSQEENGPLPERNDRDPAFNTTTATDEDIVSENYAGNVDCITGNVVNRSCIEQKLDKRSIKPTDTQQKLDNSILIPSHNEQKLRSILGEMGKNEKAKTDVISRRTAYRCGACGKMFVGEEFLRTHIERIHLKTARGAKGENKCNDEKHDENDDDMEEDFSDLEVFFRKEEADNVTQTKKLKQPLTIRKEENRNEDRKETTGDLENMICDKDGCYKSFSGRSRRILHKRHVERVHLQLKEEVCPQCNKGFYEKRDLMRHIESHHEHIKTICPMESCGKLVARLDQHVRISHSESNKSKKESVECPDCGKPFGRIYDLTRHRESVHLKIKNFVCKICEKRFTDRRDLNRHAQAIHLGIKKGQKNFSCCFCGMTFKRKKDLNNHRMEHMEEEEEFEMEHVQGVNYLEVNPNQSTIYISNGGDTVVETETEMIEVHEMETNIAVVETDGKVHLLKQGEDGLMVLPEVVEYVTADRQYVIQ